jgi:predicted nucleic acid-binding protein
VSDTLLVDSSVWITLLRGGDPELRERLTAAGSSGRLASCDPVALELLAGATTSSLPRVEALVDSLAPLRVEPSLDFRAAAALHRSARSGGFTVRALMDCLIAAVAIRHDAVIVHRDRDFDHLAQVSPLQAQRW